jgi:hypothetical protein
MMTAPAIVHRRGELHAAEIRAQIHRDRRAARCVPADREASAIWRHVVHVGSEVCARIVGGAGNGTIAQQRSHATVQQGAV